MLCGKPVETPAFIYDEGRILRAVKDLACLSDRAGFKVLFTLKPLTIADMMRLMVPYVDGFAASSLFEATLAREIIGDKGTVHMTTPGLRPAEIGRLAELCDYIAFNSLSQFSRFEEEVAGRARCGLRINPQLSFIGDDRYDPCRGHSKLGVPLDQLIAATGGGAALPDGITGLHFHTNAESETFEPLLDTVRHIDAHLSGMLQEAEWINLGGGYLFGEGVALGPFEQATELLRKKYALEVLVEPGRTIVGEAGSIVSTVIDMFDSGGKTVAVLDTTVNHMPEVFEYQYRPRVEGEVEGGPHSYVLAGCSCLAGDVFGDFAFAEPLEVGRRVEFVDAGAYAMVKWHWFNGINLPAIYALAESGELVLKKRSVYEDFAARCGAIADVAS